MLYADVIVDISSGKLDKTFQYRVPKSLEDEIAVGSQVMIPFGKGNRSISGFVVDLKGTPDYDVDKIKDIAELIHSELVIEGQLIRLAWQMKRAFGGTMNQALKTVIPVKRQVQSKTMKYYCLTEDADMLSAYRAKYGNMRRYSQRMSVLKALEDAGEPVEKSRLLSDCKVTVSVLKGLVEQGIVLESVQSYYRSPVKKLLSGNGPVVLNADQQKVVDDILADESHDTHLIHGITGSGKTEVYMELIARVIDSGQQAIVLIPEISLSLQTVSRFYGRFGNRVSIMNSKLSEGEKYDQYLRAKRGDIDIVVGPRSALFMPFARLGMIIIDEEHDGAYKSENTPRFHARDVAAWRVKMSGGILVLGSATPSVESYSRAVTGLYGLHKLQTRAREGSRLPEVSVVDLREELRAHNKKIFSRKLYALMEEKLKNHEQIMLFLNRRGYAGLVSCRSCGHVFMCRHCDISMTSHYGGLLKCHYCGYEERLPKVCPQCGSPYIGIFGTGTQKVEQMVLSEFPQARVLRMDRDTTSKKDSMDEILEKFRNHEADILIGTQMIVKGHDFPDVTLVGVLAADLSLFSNDYMASERTFQLLTQAAGRSGRDDKPGQVVIQTYRPDHYSVTCAASQDYEQFYAQEIAYRKLMHYPPAAHMLVMLVSGRDEEKTAGYMNELARQMKAFASSRNIDGMGFIGPSDALVSKGKDVYRKVLYIKCKSFPAILMVRDFAQSYWENGSETGSILLQFDLDPMSMY